jgi:hypothetical protein
MLNLFLHLQEALKQVQGDTAQSVREPSPCDLPAESAGAREEHRRESFLAHQQGLLRWTTSSFARQQAARAR